MRRLAAALLALAACREGTGLPALSSAPVPASRAVAFMDATVVTMDAPDAHSHWTVVTRGGRIVAVGPAASVAVPDDAVTIDARGRWLLPGLIDMHVHLREADAPAYVDWGVTSVRDMWGHDGVVRTKGRIAAGVVRGPTTYETSTGVDGFPPARDGGFVLQGPGDAEPVVAAIALQGVRWVKVYQNLTVAEYDAVTTAAHAHGLEVVGHVATAVPVLHALLQRQRSIEHLSGYGIALGTGNALTSWATADAERMPVLAQATVDAGTWNCPTQVVVRRLAEANTSGATATLITINRRRFLRALHDAGARLLAGTDAGIDVTAPGAALHDELAELVAAGLTPLEALRAATRDAAEFLGALDDAGTITEGRRADLLLLDADPLRDIGATRRIAGVMVRGEWVPKVNAER